MYNDNFGLVVQVFATTAKVYFQNKYYICKIKGKIKNLKDNNSILVGDYVELEKINDEYIINSIKERKNSIIRPRSANIDTVIIVQSIIGPNFNFHLLMKYLAYYETFIGNVAIMITKSDLCNKDQLDDFNFYYEIFKSANYKIFLSNNENNFKDFKKFIKNKIFCFVGNSGVGKSTLINKLLPNLSLKTQEISQSLNRGKHTTTTSQLIIDNDYYLVDTPGFSTIDINLLTPLQFSRSYHDFYLLSNKCKFANCVHINEPGCAIKDAVSKHQIDEYRYNVYCEIFKEISKV
ncbi:MAG: ribosome small subunit-dependent GTPase A [Ureaplasma sp.]|nr:ribosome small subunit-dependent GTPase A [Ureaplasma sp.]MDE7221739.1 ribosome small subunit-dependent GTPase A [Ureaplasma sp.]